MSADLMFDSDSSLSPASAEVRDLMEFGVGHWMLDYLSDGESTDWTDEETDTEDEIQECIDVVEDQTNKESCSGTLSEEEVKDSEDVSNGVEIKTNDPAVEDHNDEPAILNNPIEQDAKNGEETSNGIQVEPNDPAVEEQNGERTIIYDPIEQDIMNGEETSNGIQVEPNDPAVEDQNGERTFIYDPIEPLDLSRMTTVNNSLQKLGRKRPGAFMIYDKIKKLRLEHDYIKKAENVRRANEINEWYNREIQKPGNRKKLMIDRYYKFQKLELDIQHFSVPRSV